MISLSIPGAPIAFRARHQHRERKQYQELAQSIYEDKAIKGILVAEIVFIMPIPKSLEGRGKKVDFLPHTKKPDVDSLARFAIKNLEGILFRDSGQIIKTTVTKLYGHNPETRISIRKADIEEFNEQYN
jgi:Holliday junction resolvase RusA-like endonuclease